MKRQFLQLFFVVSLILAIGLVPLSGCACQESSQEQHACCHKMENHCGDTQQAQEKEPCCEIKYLSDRKLEISSLDKAPQFLPLGILPKFEIVLSDNAFDRFRALSRENGDDHGPPQLYLKNHSFLL